MMAAVLSIEEKDRVVFKQFKIDKQKMIAALMLSKGYHIFGYEKDEVFWPMNIGKCFHIDFYKSSMIKPIEDLCMFVGYDGNKYLVSMYSANDEIKTNKDKKWIEIKNKLPFLSVDTIIDWGEESTSPAVIKYFDDFILLAKFIDQFLEFIG